MRQAFQALNVVANTNLLYLILLNLKLMTKKEYPNCAIKSPERAKEEALMIAAVYKKKTKKIKEQKKLKD